MKQHTNNEISPRLYKTIARLANKWAHKNGFAYITDDLAQESAIRLLMAIRKHKNGEQLVTCRNWNDPALLATIVHRASVDFVGSKAGAKSLGMQTRYRHRKEERIYVGEVSDISASIQPHVSQQYIVAEEYLTGNMKEIWALLHNGYRAKDIAELYGVSPSRISQHIKKIAQNFKEHDYEDAIQEGWL